ncbi:hypothetical protein AB0911_36610 [Streptomyces nigra]|uniref:hypothetical protein n=1 Tax=Streptomyces nigra TaxID=1827580 RepID=UPI003455C6E6
MSTGTDQAGSGQGAAEASDIRSARASSLKLNGHAMINNRPCKLVEVSRSSKSISVRGIDLFTSKNYAAEFPVDGSVDVPEIRRVDYQLVDIADDYVSLMADDGTTREDLSLPVNDTADDITAKFKSGESFLVTVLSAVGEEMIVGTKF